MLIYAIHLGFSLCSSFLFFGIGRLFISYTRPFYRHGLTLITAWVGNFIHFKAWDGITYTFSNYISMLLFNLYLLLPQFASQIHLSLISRKVRVTLSLYYWHYRLLWTDDNRYTYIKSPLNLKIKAVNCYRFIYIFTRLLVIFSCHKNSLFDS